MRISTSIRGGKSDTAFPFPLSVRPKASCTAARLWSKGSWKPDGDGVFFSVAGRSVASPPREVARFRLGASVLCEQGTRCEGHDGAYLNSLSMVAVMAGSPWPCASRGLDSLAVRPGTAKSDLAKGKERWR